MPAPDKRKYPGRGLQYPYSWRCAPCCRAPTLQGNQATREQQNYMAIETRQI